MFGRKKPEIAHSLFVTVPTIVVASPYTDPEKRSELTLFAFFSSEV